MLNFEKKYKEEIIDKMIKEFGYDNVMQVPKIEKIVVNMGLGEGKDNARILENAVENLALATGQKPIITKAKKAISAFKIRKGMKIGAKVTLRSKMMYSFFEKLVSIVIPRIRDFRGLNPNSFDGRGNYSMGLKEITLFPEVDYDNIVKNVGMDITIVTTAKTDEEGRALLKYFGFPFKKN